MGFSMSFKIQKEFILHSSEPEEAEAVQPVSVQPSDQPPPHSLPWAPPRGWGHWPRLQASSLRPPAVLLRLGKAGPGPGDSRRGQKQDPARDALICF